MILVNGYRYASGNAYPTFVSYTATVFNTATTPKSTASISVNNGDVLVAFAVIEGQASTTSDLITATGGSLTWTVQNEVRVGNNTYVGCYTTTATSTTSFAVTFTHGGNAPNVSLWYGGAVLVFRDSDGVGATSKTNSTGGPSLALTTTQANSAIVAFSGDWAAVDGSSRTWRTVNSVTPTAGNTLEKLYFRDGSHYTVYGAYWDDVGAIGSKTVGLSAPVGQTYSIVAVEVKGN